MFLHLFLSLVLWGFLTAAVWAQQESPLYLQRSMDSISGVLVDIYPASVHQSPGRESGSYVMGFTFPEQPPAGFWRAGRFIPTGSDPGKSCNRLR